MPMVAAYPGVADEFSTGFVLLLLVVAVGFAAYLHAPLTGSHRAAVALDGLAVHEGLGVDEERGRSDDEQAPGQDPERWAS
jgi:hypothetical protein